MQARSGLYTLMITFSLMLSSCMVGPDFHSPAAPKTDQYTAELLPQKTVSAAGPGGASQYFTKPQDIPAQWWALFHSTELDNLVRQGIANSPNLAAAQAALREAQENLRAGQGALFPTVGLNAAGARQQTVGASFGAPSAENELFTVYNTSLNASYVLDLFGGIRRQIEALGAEVDFAQYEWEATYLTLTANIVTTAISEASLHAQIAATQALIHDQEQQLKIVKQQFQLGGVSKSDVLTQQTQLAQTRATLPPLQKSLAQLRDAMAVLVGKLPSQAYLPNFYLDKLILPKQLPVSLPSNLVRQRPDIQAAEALLHAANAKIGVTTANLFPQITLNASYGSVATSLGEMFASDSNVWSLGAAVLQPIFEGGTRLAQRRAAIAARNQTAAQYRQTVLAAFQNVADALHAVNIDAKTLQAEARAEASAKASLVLTQEQFKLGAVNYLSLLTAQQQYQQTRINRIQAEAARYADTAALFQALGGGWWNRPTHLGPVVQP